MSLFFDLLANYIFLLPRAPPRFETPSLYALEGFCIGIGQRSGIRSRRRGILRRRGARIHTHSSFRHRSLHTCDVISPRDPKSKRFTGSAMEKPFGWENLAKLFKLNRFHVPEWVLWTNAKPLPKITRPSESCPYWEIRVVWKPKISSSAGSRPCNCSCFPRSRLNELVLALRWDVAE